MVDGDRVVRESGRIATMALYFRQDDVQRFLEGEEVVACTHLGLFNGCSTKLAVECASLRMMVPDRMPFLLFSVRFWRNGTYYRIALLSELARERVVVSQTSPVHSWDGMVVK
jgi:hypothetical protein